MKRFLGDFFTDDTAQRAGMIEKKITGRRNPPVTGLEYDSRKIGAGNIFFALPGLHIDGHRYIADAIKRGASAVVHQDELKEYQKDIVYIRVKDSRFAMSPISAAFYDYPSRKLTIIGITGTEGKSTTVYLIYQLLCLAGEKAGFISTVKYGNGKTELPNPEHQTTPEATILQRQLAEIAKNGAKYAVVEASSHGLSPRTNRLGDVDFDIAVMTNVTHEHLEFHGTWEQCRKDKANLFQTLDLADHQKENRSAGQTADEEYLSVPSFGVVNADDPSAQFFTAATLHKTYTYSTCGSAADLALQCIESGISGNWYEVFIQETRELADIRDRLPGAFNAGNVLATLITVSKLLLVPVKELIPLVMGLKPVLGRMTLVWKGQPFEVLVDYAHTPSSFETIFPPLRERINRTPDRKSRGRIVSLFGSAGERDTKKRREQGRIAAKWSDLVLLTDEDPRGEKPMDILEEIAAGCSRKTRGKDLFLIPDRPQAIRKAFALARPGDLVLLLGKGHENSIIYAKETRPYDEIGEAEKALEELGWNR
jgi:UDP-N-acetylmuramoyl-L-alanyl-D-glutamate--2,6-diaminopimelate ligase